MCKISVQANLIWQKVHMNMIHIVYLSSYQYMSLILYKLALLICLVCFIAYCKFLCLFTLEVRVINVASISLYCWLGFHFLAKRYNYYFSQYEYKFTAAYNLINCKFLSKNIFRRCLILTTISF
uniref:hypothetical protein n=1 Tax=Anunuuluaehu liula TaxID=3049639 RepID=UPI003002F5CD